MKADTSVVPEIVRSVVSQFRSDVKARGQYVQDLEDQIQSHKKFNVLRQDWAEKRIKSIFREVDRLGIKIDSVEGSELRATFQDVTLIGEVYYEQMDRIEAYKPWKRPKIVVSFWVLDSQGNKCWLEGHVQTALKIVFGTHRMLTYNRLFAAVLSAMAR
jgi:hypothetical protein